jgi:hypothetical protein
LVSSVVNIVKNSFSVELTEVVEELVDDAVELVVAAAYIDAFEVELAAVVTGIPRRLEARRTGRLSLNGRGSRDGAKKISRRGRIFRAPNEEATSFKKQKTAVRRDRPLPGSGCLRPESNRTRGGPNASHQH